MTLKETHQQIDQIIEDFQETIKRARSAKMKRRNNTAMNLFKSIKKHLKPLEDDSESNPADSNKTASNDIK